MDSRHFSRRWTVLGLALGLVLSGIAPAAAARKSTRPGWDSVGFSGNGMFYEAPFPRTGSDLSYLVITAYDGDFRPDKRTTYPASVLVAEASGGECIIDDGSYGTETGYVMNVVQVVGAQQVGEAITFESSHDGSLDVRSLKMTGTQRVWEAEDLGPQACRGIAVLSEQAIEKTLDIAIAWSSVKTVISVPKGKSGKTTEETRWVTSITSATGAMDAVDLNLPFGPGGTDEYVAWSFHSSGSVMIPTGTFE